MAKDYGRTPQKNHKSGFSKQLLLTLVSFLLGYLSALTVDFTSVKSWINTQLVAQNLSPVAPKPVLHAQLPKPKFEFYTLLASGQQASPPKVSQPATAAQQAGTTVPVVKTQAVVSAALANVVEAKPAVISKDSYLVQVASFKSKQEAERMKASLTLKGFMVNVIAVNQQNTNWYRVALGPFASRSQAQKAQLSISKSEHIVGMIRKMDA